VNSKYGAGALEKAIQTIQEAHNNDRNNTFYAQARGCFELAAGGELAFEQAWERLAEAGSAAGLDRAEIRATLRSAHRDGSKKPRQRPDGNGGGRVETLPSIPPAPPVYPPLRVVDALWKAADSVLAHDDACAYLESRGLDLERVSLRGRCRYLPKGAPLPDELLAQRRDAIPKVELEGVWRHAPMYGFRLLFPLHDSLGNVRSLQLRCIVDHGENFRTKSVALKPQKRGLVLANRAGLALLRRDPERSQVWGEQPLEVVLVEGETDFLCAGCEDIDASVVIATDIDAAGERYADKIRRTLEARSIQRWTPRQGKDVCDAGGLDGGITHMSREDAARAEIEELRNKMEASNDADERLLIADEIAAKRAALESNASNVVPLFPEGERPKFPLHIFRDENTVQMVKAIARATENPIDPVAFVVFGMKAATYGMFARIQRNEGYISWCCDYSYLTGGSSVGKTPIFKLAQHAAHEVEATLREETLERYRDAQALIARLEEDKRLCKRSYKGGDKEAFEADIRDLNSRIEEAEGIVMPELILHDCSPEAMLLAQSQNDDTATMISAELPILSRLLGQSTGKPPDIDALLSSYDGEFYRVNRITRKKNWIDEARLSILGGTQMSVIEGLRNRPELWDRGLINRFWFCVAPEPTEDDMVDESVGIDDEILAPYKNRLVELGLLFRRHRIEPYVLSAKADRVYTSWRNEFKRRHRLPGGELHHITGFCRKLENKVLRWATNMHIFADHQTREVSAQSIQDAMELGTYALAHFEHVYGLMHGSQASSIERALRTHLARKKGKEVTLRDIKRGLHSFAKASVEVQDEALDNLVEDGFLKRKEAARREGGRPSLRIVVL
jgi:hypothetical protein